MHVALRPSKGNAPSDIQEEGLYRHQYGIVRYNANGPPIISPSRYNHINILILAQ